jgi:DNA-binding Lrp family transcriptional regulator
MSDQDRILKLLQKNARLSEEQIAERLKLDAAAVKKTISACEGERSILGYFTVVDDKALSKDRVRAIIEVSVEPERDSGFDKIASLISKFDSVTDVILVSGDYDLLLVVEGEDLQEVANFVASRLSPLDGVRQTRTHFLLKKFKEAGFQYETDEDHERLSITL